MGASIGLQELWNEPCENADRLQSRPERTPRTDDRTQARDVNDRVRCTPMAKSDQVPRRTEGPRRPDGNSRPPSAAATIDDTVPLLDSGVLQTLRDLSGPGDETFFVEVIDLYLKDSVALVGAIRQAALSRDAQALMPAAHSLRSSSGNVGAASLSAVCRALECAASGNGMDDVDPLLAQLERIYPLVCRALRVECERTQP
ncbi:MAG: Hpt domain-containing protein [Defluviicoccus sp.]|nr:Hpt domain-containing protein [Defluviicoccus sp.]MDG4608458.1 Hpt domain-containing protein [Defluviicoccus sp.]